MLKISFLESRLFIFIILPGKQNHFIFGSVPHKPVNIKFTVCGDSRHVVAAHMTQLLFRDHYGALVVVEGGALCSSISAIIMSNLCVGTVLATICAHIIVFSVMVIFGCRIQIFFYIFLILCVFCTLSSFHANESQL